MSVSLVVMTDGRDDVLARTIASAREMLEGELASLKQSLLPAGAALGGMLVPALIYAAINWNDAVALRG